MIPAEFPSSAVFLLICASILFVLVALWWLGDWLQEQGQNEFEDAAGCGFGPHCHRSKSCPDTECQGHPKFN